MPLNAKRFDTGEFSEFTIEEGRITSIVPAEDASLDGHKRFVAPGFWDIQINGGFGHEFVSPNLTTEQIETVVRHQFVSGVTKLFPTLTTSSADNFTTALKVFQSPDLDSTVRKAIDGIHLEGPYISSIDGPRGAHPTEHCRPPCWDEFCRFQEAAGGIVKLMTLSPEYDEAPEFIQKAVASGVVISIGHTAATSDQIKAAVDAGATLSTHLGNGAHGTIRRHPNYIWDQLAEDRLNASLIADGYHLPAEVLKSFVRGKTLERIILVSDISGLAGQSPGLYQGSGGDVEILENGQLVVAGQRQYLSGASLPITLGITNLMRHAEVSLAEAIKTVTLHPARLFDDPLPPTLLPGRAADLCVFSMEETDQGPELKVQQTMIGGEIVFER